MNNFYHGNNGENSAENHTEQYQENREQGSYRNVIPEAEYYIEGEKMKKGKDNKKNDFFRTLAKGAAYAAVFGLVAGASFGGFQYISNTFSSSQKSVEQRNSTIDGDQGNSADGQLKLEQNSSQDTSSNNNITQVHSTSGSADVSEITENMMPSIVAINCQVVQTGNTIFGQTVQQEGTGSGTGIIIKQDNEYLYIATNNHVVEDAKEIEVVFHDTKTAAAQVKGTDSSSDLAVIMVKLSDISSDTKSIIRTAVLGDSNDVKLGEMAVAIGNALGNGQSVTVGYISATNREVEMDNGTMTLLQTDAAINPGNSGGALVNIRGEVIGINSVKYASDEVEGMGFAIPISDAVPILEDLMNREEVAEADQGCLGIEGYAVGSEYQSMYGMPAGVFIKTVKEGSAAEKAGLKPGYIITSVKGRNVSSVEDVQQIMAYTKGGTTVEVTYMTQTDSEYTEKTVNVTLGKKGDSEDYVPSEASDGKNGSESNGQGSQQMPYGYGNNNGIFGGLYGYGNGSNDEYQSGFPYGYLQ